MIEVSCVLPIIEDTYPSTYVNFLTCLAAFLAYILHPKAEQNIAVQIEERS